MQNTRAVHVIDHLEPGGAQTLLRTLTAARPLDRVIALHSSGSAADLASEFPDVEILARRRYSILLILARLVRVVLRDRKRAIFVAHLDASTLFLCLLRRLVNFRLVVTLHAIQDQWPAWYRASFRNVIFAADHVISGGRRAYDELLALGFPDDRITLIPIGTSRSPDSDAGTETDIRKELGIAADQPIFLNVARMVPGKGQVHLVRAMALVPDGVAVIVGDGPELSRLREETARLGLQERVRFCGRRTDLDRFYASARAFVMPCLDESMGVVVYDALVYKLPVVAYASGTIGEIVKDGENGYLMQPDSDALAAALRKVLAKETEFRFLPADTYSARTMIDRHNALYLALQGKWPDLAGHPIDG